LSIWPMGQAWRAPAATKRIIEMRRANIVPL